MLEEGAVYQANPLVEAIKYESVDENRLFLACLKKLNPHLPTSKYFDEDFKDIVIPSQEIIDFFGGNDYYYTELVEIAKKLLGTYIFIEDKEIKTFRGYTVFEYIEFGKKFGGLHFKFTNSMKPFLLDLYNKGFTGINLKEIFNLRSSYALRILELLLQYKGMANNEGIYERIFTFERLRKILNIPSESYKRPSSFLKDVIVASVNAINKKTRYTVTYTVQRKGKKAIGVTLQVTLPKDLPVKETIDVDIIESKSKPKQEDLPTVVQAPLEDVPEELALPEHNSLKVEKSEQQEPDKLTKKKLNDYTNEELKVLKKLLEIKLNKDTALELVDECGIKAIKKAFIEMNQTRQKGVLIENPAGFIRYKTHEYFNSETEISEEDIFARVAEIEENERQEQIRLNEETERQKAEENSKEAERKANRQPWQEWEIQILAQNYIKNGNTFVDADRKSIEERGWKPEELLSKPEYMAYFRPNSEISQYIRIRRKKNKAGDSA